MAGTTKTHWLPSFIWWTISYEFCCIAGIAVIVTADAIHTYQVAVSLSYNIYNYFVQMTNIEIRLLDFWQQAWFLQLLVSV